MDDDGVSSATPLTLSGDIRAADTRPGWVHLLATGLRLVDAHDSGRRQGAEHRLPPDELRRGSSDGVYLTVAWLLLEWLRDQEIHGALDYVDITPFAEDVAGAYGLSVTDIQYLALLLSTPTILRFVVGSAEGQPVKRSTADTALIEKQRRGYGCRLSRVGRDAIAFAGGYFKWVHAGAEARKLVIDIRNGDLLSFQQQALRLLSRIRSETLEIRRAIERPEVEELRAIFMRDAKHFNHTISDVSAVLSDVQSEMLSPTTRSEIDAAAAALGDDAPTLTELGALVASLLNALASLQKMFSRFVVEVQRRDRSLIGVVRFDAIAQSLLMAPMGTAITPEALETVFAGIGPLLPDIHMFSPMELSETIAAPRVRERRQTVMRSVGPAAAVLDRIEQFIARNQALLHAILGERPLSLRELLTSDELDYQDLEFLVDAATLMVSPLVLRFGDDPRLRVRLAVGSPGRWSLPDGWELSGRDLTMTLERIAPGAKGTRR